MVDYSGLNIQLLENIFTSPSNVFKQLEEEVQYLPPEKSSICIKGKVCKIPRQIAAFGDPGTSYTFSGLTVTCKPWTASLLEIKNVVEKLSSCSFNYVLINRYKDGDDCIGQHKDNKSDLTKGQPICSVSLGENRKMVFKRPYFEDHTVELVDNSLLIMREPTNLYWTHGIPRQPEKKDVRLSLTFRKIVSNCKNGGSNIIEENKREIKTTENVQRCGLFKVNEIPEDVYSVGGDVFLYRVLYRCKPIIHLRRYKNYGQTFYPTKEGVTMDIHQFSALTAYPVLRERGISFKIDDRRGYSLDISIAETGCYKLTKCYNYPGDQQRQTSIVISREQWKKMKDNREKLMKLCCII